VNLRHLEAFVAVARQGGFTRAADRLCLTQPTVSGQIKELEEELGLTLFHRFPRRVELTEAGERLLPRAEEVLRARDRLLEEAAAYQGLAIGTLQVHASTIPGEYLLPAFLARFKRGHPGVRVILRVADSGDVVRRVQSGEAEVGVVGERGGEDGLAYRRLWRDRVGLFAPAGWNLPPVVPPRALGDLPVVLREPGSGTRRAVERALGPRVRRLRVVAEFGSTAAVLEAVRAGIGAGFVSERAAAAWVEAGRIAAVAVEGVLPVERWFYAVWDPRRTPGPAAEAFLRLLEGSAEPSPPHP